MAGAITVCYFASHEAIHAQIFIRYGATPHVEFDPLKLYASTTVSPEDALKCNDACKTQHAFNDIAGYNVAVIIICAWALFLTFIIYKFLYYNYGRKKRKV